MTLPGGGGLLGCVLLLLLGLDTTEGFLATVRLSSARSLLAGNRRTPVDLCGTGISSSTSSIAPPSRMVTTSTSLLATSWFGGGGKDPQALVRQGMDEFRQGKVTESLELFDQALTIGGKAIEPYLWQRGLSLYYVDKFEEGAKQFRIDVNANPNDTEESVWTFLCEAQIPSIGFDGARKQMLQVGTDPRPYMRAAYDLFRGKASEEDLAKEGAVRGSPAEFYSLLYLGLYAESRKETDKARQYIEASVATPFGKAGRDYMTSLARVHLLVRGWT